MRIDDAAVPLTKGRKVQSQAKNQANNWKIDGLKPSSVSILSYKTKKEWGE